MAPSLISKQYSADDFTSLSEHNATTPSTFFSLTPVLHLHCPASQIKISRDILNTDSPFAALQAEPSETSEQIVEITNVEVWVTSKYVDNCTSRLTTLTRSRFIALSTATTDKSVIIDYPTISVHGQQGESVMLELRLSDDDAPGIDVDFAQIDIQPTEIGQGDDIHLNGGTNGSAQSAATQLYHAIGDCQELNPDGSLTDDDERPVPAPGDGGWITADNMEQFIDEEGNFSLPSSAGAESALGQGAGVTRTATEVDEDADEEHTKWQRMG